MDAEGGDYDLRVAHPEEPRSTSVGTGTGLGEGSGALPSPSTTLLYRDAERAELGRALRDERMRVITLVGAPGIGKTRLAIAAAEDWRRATGHPVAFADLTTIRDAAEVSTLSGQVLGIRYLSQQTIPTEETIARLVRDRHVLLVLDNFEHVLPATPFLDVLLNRCPNLKFLVTSRAPLRIAAEQQFSVPPLAVPDARHLPGLESLRDVPAVGLFRLRAKAADASWEITPATAREVAEICVRLDGLPLAIELAAAWMRILSPADLLGELLHAMDVLVAPNKHLPERHQALRAAIRWSNDLLDAGQQRRFRQLAVFVGGFTLEACRAVWGSDGGNPADALHALAALHDRHLVVRESASDGRARFGLLETIKAFAFDELSLAGELEQTLQRHAAYYASVAERAESEYNSPAQTAWLATLEFDRGNLHAALHWCAASGDAAWAHMGLRLGAALWFFWDVRGHVREGRAPLNDLLSLTSVAEPTLERARALQTAAWLAYVQGDAAAVLPLVAESLVICELLGDRLGIARALAIEGVTTSLYSAEFQRTREVLTRALELGRELSDTWTIGFATYSLSLVAMREGHLAEAWKQAEACRTISEHAGNTWGQACALYRLSFLRAQGGRVDEAIRLQQESLRMNWELRNVRVIALNLVLLACFAHARTTPKAQVLLLGAADACFDASSYALPPSLNGIYEPVLTRLRAALGRDFEAVWSTGRSMSLSDAVAVGISIGEAQREGRARLSERELQVARLVSEGLTDREIGGRLGISPRTVDNHLRSVFVKANVPSRSALAAWVVRSDIAEVN